MAFPVEVVEELLVACHRHCCVCHKPCGANMEIHHMLPKAQGGADTFDNGIPLCFDCHANVAAYNPKHPKGRKFSPSELRKHREQWFAIASAAPWHRTFREPDESLVSVEAAVDLGELLKVLRVENLKPGEELAFALMHGPREARHSVIKAVIENFDAQDEEGRWKLGHLLEEFVVWEPNLVPIQAIERMARDESFSVRSSAAVCFNYIAGFNPAAVPLDLLIDLARFDEDWYVMMPATNALLRLARTRRVVLEVFGKNLAHPDPEARERAAHSILRLAQNDWDLVSDYMLEAMDKSPDRTVRKFGKQCRERVATKGPIGLEYGLF